jgi:hypothetical protein
MRLYLYAAAALPPAAVLTWWLLAVLINKPEGDHHRPPWWRRMRERRLEERAQNAVTVRLFEDIHNGLRGEAARAATSEMPRVEWPLAPLPPGAEEYADHFHRPVPEVDYDTARYGWNYEDGPAPDEPEPTPETARALDAITGAYRDGIHRMLAAGIGEAERGETVTHEDPLDVATPEQVADEYVGDICPRAFIPAGGGSGSGLHICTCSRSDGHSEHHLCPECGVAWTLASETPEPLPAPEPEPAPLTDYGEQTGSWEALVDAVMPKDGA